MYWQNRFERENPDKKLEKEILDIRKVHKDYGYRRIWGELRNRNIFVKYVHYMYVICYNEKTRITEKG